MLNPLTHGNSHISSVSLKFQHKSEKDKKKIKFHTLLFIPGKMKHKNFGSIYTHCLEFILTVYAG